MAYRILQLPESDRRSHIFGTFHAFMRAQEHVTCMAMNLSKVSKKINLIKSEEFDEQVKEF